MVYQTKEALFKTHQSTLTSTALKVSMRATQSLQEWGLNGTKPPGKEKEGSIAGFNIKEITIADSLGKYTFHALTLPSKNASIKEMQEANRKTDRTGTHLVLPLGPVEGNYYNGHPSQVKYIFKTSTGEKDAGPKDVVARFPGLDPKLDKEFGGGIAVVNGSVKIVNQQELKELASMGLPVAQTFFSWTSENAQELMSQNWTHFGKNLKIGNSRYMWSWYVETGNGKVYFVTSKFEPRGINTYPLNYINQVNTALARKESWKTALSDSGLGGGFVIKTATGNTYSNFPRPELLHTIPAYLRVNSDLETSDTRKGPVFPSQPTHKSVPQKIDAYLRDPKTPLARFIATRAPSRGPEYLQKDPRKRAMDLAIATPLAIASTPVVISAAAAVFAEDRKNPFFVHKRLGSNGQEINTVKIRRLKVQKGKSQVQIDEEGRKVSVGKVAWEDPRSTRIGRWMVKRDLDELPQLWQVISGKLSLVGIRISAENIIEELRKGWTPERFSKWRQMYENSNRLGITGVNQIFGSQNKNDLVRYHGDRFYAENANLGLDLYLAWRTAARMLRLLPRKTHNFSDQKNAQPSSPTTAE